MHSAIWCGQSLLGGRQEAGGRRRQDALALSPQTNLHHTYYIHTYIHT